VSLLMLAVVALFPIVLLALLLITSGLEGRVVGRPTSEVGTGDRSGTPG
jgi:L-lactate permease